MLPLPHIIHRCHFLMPAMRQRIVGPAKNYQWRNLQTSSMFETGRAAFDASSQADNQFSKVRAVSKRLA